MVCGSRSGTVTAFATRPAGRRYSTTARIEYQAMSPSTVIGSCFESKRMLLRSENGEVERGMQRAGRADLSGGRRLNGCRARMVDEMGRVHEHDALGGGSRGHARDGRKVENGLSTSTCLPAAMAASAISSLATVGVAM